MNKTETILLGGFTHTNFGCESRATVIVSILCSCQKV